MNASSQLESLLLSALSVTQQLLQVARAQIELYQTQLHVGNTTSLSGLHRALMTLETSAVVNNHSVLTDDLVCCHFKKKTISVSETIDF